VASRTANLGELRSTVRIWTLGPYGAVSVTHPHLGELRSIVRNWTLELYGASSVTDPLKI